MNNSDIWLNETFKKEMATMTREEARHLVFKHTNLEGRESLGLVNAIEALGLLKFDEEKPPKGQLIFFPHYENNRNNCIVKLDDAIKTFEEYGYEVKRKPTVEVSYETNKNGTFVPVHVVNNCIIETHIFERYKEPLLALIAAGYKIFKA